MIAPLLPNQCSSVGDEVVLSGRMKALNISNGLKYYRDAWFDNPADACFQRPATSNL